MTEEFVKWFEQNVPTTMFSGDEESLEDVKVFCWLAWRDSRRAAGGAQHDPVFNTKQEG